MSFVIALSTIAVMAAVTYPVGASTLTQYDVPWTFSCLNDQALTGLASTHDNSREDRRWSFKCRDLPVAASMKNCRWSDWVNIYDAPVDFICDNGGVIQGLQSVHSDAQEDRIYKYKCCNADDYIPYRCKITGYQNEMDGPLNYVVPHGKVLTGMFSYHSDRQEDRRFRFNECSLVRVEDPLG